MQNVELKSLIEQKLEDGRCRDQRNDNTRIRNRNGVHPARQHTHQHCTWQDAPPLFEQIQAAITASDPVVVRNRAHAVRGLLCACGGVQESGPGAAGNPYRK